MMAAYNTIIQAAHKCCTPVLHPQLCHELQICALPHGQFTLHRVHIFLQEVHQLAQWVGSPCQSLYWATQTFNLTASQLPFPAASCLPLLMPQEWDMQSKCVCILHWHAVLQVYTASCLAQFISVYSNPVYWAAESNFIKFQKHSSL